MSTPSLSDFVDDSVLTDGHIITTTVTASDGSKLTSSLDLNSCIGNVNGALAWGGSNFSNGAQNIQMNDGGQLECDLPDSNGGMSHSIMWIGSLAGGDGKIHHYAVPPFSQAHAVANDNAQADAAVQSQAQTTGSSRVEGVTTLVGDASTYWPEGNAPAAGHHISTPRWSAGQWVLHILECF